MAKKTKVTGKGRLDKYYHLAKEQGFRSRAAFKLVQLNKKYNFLSSARTLLDLCAAPGSWMQVASKNMPVSSVIVGVDLAPIRPIPNCVSLIEDITTAKCRSALKKHISPGTCDVVLHDGAPNVGQSWTQDAYTQSELVLHAAKLATEFLRKGGLFVTKIFRSQDYNALLWVFQQLFKRVEATKPLASRNTSAEIFVVCEDFLAPKSIDPKLLDPKHAFQLVDMPSKPLDVFHKKAGKRKRDGYDEDAPISMFVKCPVEEFVKSDAPVAMLAQYSAFAFEGPHSHEILSHPATSEDIKVYCSDLKVLGKKEFKEILKWRLQVREHMHAQQTQEESGGESTSEGTGDEEEAADSPENEEAKLATELREMKRRLAAKQKAAKRKEQEKKSKYQRRVDLKMILPGDKIEQTAGDGLFSLSQMKSAADLERVASEIPTADMDEYGSEGSDVDHGPALKNRATRGANAGNGDEEAEEDYEAKLEEYFDEMYENYLESKGSRSERRKLGRRKEEQLQLKEQLAADIANMVDEAPGDYVPDFATDVLEDDDRRANSNPLLVEVDNKGSVEASKASRWFSRPLFAGEAESSDEEGFDTVHVTPTGSKNSTKELKSVLVEQDHAKSQTKALAPGIALTSLPSETESDDSSDEEMEPREEDYDSDEKRDILAIGTMLKTQGKKAAVEVIDNAYNRYAFADRDAMPKWFAEEEREFSVRQMPVTKEVMDAIRARMKAIDARPIKKVAEAKARKTRRALQALEKMKKKANNIVEASDLTEKAKSRAVDKLYKAGASKVRSGHLKVLKKSGKKVMTSGKPKSKIVDARLKKDKRQGKAAKKANSKGGGRGKRSAGKGQGKPAKKARS
eukprot:tig00000217_g19151.t1